VNSETEMPTDISIVIPAYNEAGKLEKAVHKTADFMMTTNYSFEIIIAEDGSTDGTSTIASALAKKYPYIRHFHRDSRLGKGLVITKAFKISRGEVLISMDVDLSTELRFLKPLIESISEGYDFATGSRMLHQSRVERSSTRHLTSIMYNLAVRLILNSRIWDHQCGFKAYKRKSLFNILDKVKAKHWFWDTELLVLASRSGYRIKEIPVVWRGGETSKVHVLPDALKMGLQIVELWLRLRVKPHNL